MLLIESIIRKPILEETNRENLPQGVLSRVTYPICNLGQRNANNRVYEKAVFEKVLGDDSIQEKLENRNLFGQAEHPAETQSDLQLTSHVIHKMWIDEKENIAYQTLDIVDTPTGRIVDSLLRAECMVGVSTRAEGDIEEAEDDEGAYHRIVPESYNYVTTDFTADPSTFGVVPMDVKRNAISEIKKELENKELKEDEKKFTQLILESMECKDGKCVMESAKKLAKEAKEKKEIKEGRGEEIYQEALESAKEDILNQMKGGRGYDEFKVRDRLVKEFGISNGEAEAVIEDAAGHDELDLGEHPSFESKTQTIEDLVKNEFIKIGAIVEFKAGEHKDKKGKVEKIEEGSVSVSVGEDSDSVVNVNVYGNTYTSVSPDGVITVLPVPSMETDVMEQPPEEAEPELPPEEEEEVIDPPVEEEESEEEEVEEKCKDKKKVKEQEVEVPDKDARSDRGIPFNVIPVEKGLGDKILPGNVLRDKEEKYWVVKDLNVNGLSVETAGGGVGAEIKIPWEEVENRGLTKVQEVKDQKVTYIDIGYRLEKDKHFVFLVKAALEDPTSAGKEEAIHNYVVKLWGNKLDNDPQAIGNAIDQAVIGLGLGESKIDEVEDIHQMYKAAGLPTPDGKGVHTKAFHKLAIDVAKGYVEGGDSPKKALKKAYPTAMKQLGKEKAVKKAHKSESKVIERVQFPGTQKELNILMSWTNAGTETLMGQVLNTEYQEDKREAGIDLEQYFDKWYKDYEEALGDSGESEFVVDKEKMKDYIYSFISEKSESKEVKESVWTDNPGEQFKYVENWLKDARGDKISDLYLEFVHTITPATISKYREEILDNCKSNTDTLSDVYKHIWKGIYGPSEFISTTAKEMIDLRIQEASTRAERDKAFEVVAELEALEEQLGKGNSNKLLEVKILIKKLKETMSRDGQVINALRRKVEEKAVLAKQVEKQLSEMKANLEKDMAELIAESKESNHLVTQGSEKAMSQLRSSYDKEVKDLNESKASTEKKHSKEIKQLKTESDKKISEEVEKARKEVTENVTKEFVKQFVMFRLAETGLTVDENSRALLEECRSLDQVDDTLDELRDIGRRSALHSQPLKEVVITEPVDPDQADVDRKVGAVFEGFGYKKGINDD